MKTLIERCLVSLAFAAGSMLSCPLHAQVYSGLTAAGTLALSNFQSNETPTTVLVGATSTPATVQDTHFPKEVPLVIPSWLNLLIEESARENGLDPLLLHAVIRVESGYNAKAVSRQGARGLMQLMPNTALRFGVRDLFDPRSNLRAGAQYLRWLLKRFNGDIELALAGYNAGEQAVIRSGYRIPNYNETRKYVPRVIGYYIENHGL